MFHEDKQGNLVLSPKASFAFGLLGGVLVLCTLGFFILLGVVMKGGMPSKKDVAAKPSAAAPTAVAPTAADPSAPEDTVGDVPEITDADHIKGALDDYEVTLVEYSDFQCPFCGRFHPTMEQLMKDPAYKGKIRWVYRHFPLSFHPNAVPAANASECAAEQGKFFEFADEIYANQDSMSDDFYSSTAKKIGLNMTKFDSCYSAKKYQSKVDSDYRGGTQAGVSGTPATIIITNDGQKQLIPGALPLEQVKGMIDAMLR